MKNNQLFNAVKVTPLSDAVAAGQTDVTVTADTLGFSGVGFAVHMGAITAGSVVTAKLQYSDDNGSTDAYSDVEDSAQVVADTDDNKLLLIEVYRPKKRYVKLVITRATQNAAIQSILGFLFNASMVPVTQPTSVLATVQMNSPSEGTA